MPAGMHDGMGSSKSQQQSADDNRGHQTSFKKTYKQVNPEHSGNISDEGRQAFENQRKAAVLSLSPSTSPVNRAVKYGLNYFIPGSGRLFSNYVEKNAMGYGKFKSKKQKQLDREKYEELFEDDKDGNNHQYFLPEYAMMDGGAGLGGDDVVEDVEDETIEYHLGKGEQKTGRDVTDIRGYAAHGGIMGLRARKAFGGIMDRVTGRKAYGLGSIFKSVKKAVGKVLKSDVGKAAILGFGLFGVPGGTEFTGGLLKSGVMPAGWRNKLLMKQLTKKTAEEAATYGGLDWWKVAGLAGVAAPFIEGAPWNKVKPNESLGMAERGGHLIDPITGKEALPNQMRASLENALNTADGDPQKIAAIKEAYPFYGIDERLGSYVPYRNYSVANGGRIGKAEGGLMDLGGMEKDYRAEGGFVPIGAKEKADDVPARLSVNEFVFTADAVRNAGGGDIDQGAEVMENVMKNLEAGGKISAETQGNTGAQEMFSVSERLGEVI